MNYHEILKETEKFVIQLFEREASPKYTYHDIIHTKAVVKRAKKIGENCNLNEKELVTVIIAAWFHDTGYMSYPKCHEAISIKIAKEFLQSKGVEQKTIEQISRCIAATKFPHNPKDKLSKVLCDADLSHLAHPDFFQISKLLHNELNNIQDKDIDIHQYWIETLKVFISHNYYTEYGRKVLSKRKEINFRLLKDKIKSDKK